MAIRLTPTAIHIGTGQLYEYSNGIFYSANATFVQTRTLGPGNATGYGYVTGGGSPGGISDVIQKFPFSADANSADVGDLLSGGNYGHAGQSSSTHGYASSGWGPGAYNTIQKFPFASDANATDVGDSIVADRLFCVGQSSSTHGYTSGGEYVVALNSIEKFPFATNANATDVGDLTVARATSAGQSSEVSGYTSGGVSYAGPSPISNVIDKFPFASDANATDVGDLTVAKYYLSGQSSSTHGYATGGRNFSVAKRIDRFSFSSDGNATNVGDLIAFYDSNGTSAGISSASSGYAISAEDDARFHKFSFANENNSSEVGSLLSSGISSQAGHETPSST